jgi:hypothetical protein
VDLASWSPPFARLRQYLGLGEQQHQTNDAGWQVPHVHSGQTKKLLCCRFKYACRRTPSSTFQCSLCKITFPTSQSLIRHPLRSSSTLLIPLSQTAIMKACFVLSVLGATIAPALAAKGNLPPVTVKGNAFFADNKRFYVRGVAYQPGTLSRCFECCEDMLIPA